MLEFLALKPVIVCVVAGAIGAALGALRAAWLLRDEEADADCSMVGEVVAGPWSQ